MGSNPKTFEYELDQSEKRLIVESDGQLTHQRGRDSGSYHEQRFDSVAGGIDASTYLHEVMGQLSTAITTAKINLPPLIVAGSEL